MKAINSKIDSFAKLQARNLPERKKRLLCTNIDRVKALATKIMERQRDSSQTYGDAVEIKNAIFEIKEQAIAMEKRLYLYKETIEALGFKRVRK